MEEAFNAITSPAWWVGVVIVGLLINLAAAYLKPHLDEAASSVSLRWATRTKEQRRQRLQHIERLRGDVYEQLLTSFDAVYIAIVGVVLLLLSMFSVIIFSFIATQYGRGWSIPSLFIGLLFIILATKYLLTFGRVILEVREARQSEDGNDQAHT